MTTTVIRRILFIWQGRNPINHTQNSAKGKGSRLWHATLFYRAHTFSICPFCSPAVRSFWRVRILRSNDGVNRLFMMIHRLSGRLYGALRADGYFYGQVCLAARAADCKSVTSETPKVRVLPCPLFCSRIPIGRGNRFKLGSVRVRLPSEALCGIPAFSLYGWETKTEYASVAELEYAPG